MRNNENQIKSYIMYANLLGFASFGNSIFTGYIYPPFSKFIPGTFHNQFTIQTAYGKKI